MDNYALNFNRKRKGLKSGDDLVYFGKVEHFRRFKGNEEEVKKGAFSSGEYKPGLNSHIHIIVSRKDQTQGMKLSPLANERGKDRKIGENDYRVGFDRTKWSKTNENSFDELMKYQRKAKEKCDVQNILKNGSPKEKDDLLKRIAFEKKNKKSEHKKGLIQNEKNKKRRSKGRSR